MAEDPTRAIFAAALLTAVDEFFDNLEQGFAAQWDAFSAMAAVACAAEGTHVAALAVGTAALGLATTERLRRFWSIRHDNFKGFWEKQVLGDWVGIGALYPDREDAEYLKNFRLTKGPFWDLYETIGKAMERQAAVREPIAGAKRFAICLDWLSSGSFYRQLAAKYDVSAAAVHAAVHEGIHLLLADLVPREITMPSSREELQQVTRPCDK
jgi:hypothetical protein